MARYARIGSWHACCGLHDLHQHGPLLRGQLLRTQGCEQAMHKTKWNASPSFRGGSTLHGTPEHFTTTFTIQTRKGTSLFLAPDLSKNKKAMAEPKGHQPNPTLKPSHFQSECNRVSEVLLPRVFASFKGCCNCE
eukprot:1142872-Pelagomonas_calceolata.AAC.4